MPVSDAIEDKFRCVSGLQLNFSQFKVLQRFHVVVGMALQASPEARCAVWQSLFPVIFVYCGG